MRKLKIGVKLLVILMVCALLPLLVLSALAVSTMRSISLQSTQATTQLGTQAALDSRIALQAQAEGYLEKIAREQALKTDAVLERIGEELGAVAQYIESLYAAPEGFAPVPLPYPYETENDVAAAKYMVALSAVHTPELETEIGLIGNLSYMAAPIYEKNESISNLYFGSASGIVYRYSARNNYDESYEARLRPWYTQAVQAKGQLIWTQTEIDSYGILCVTAAIACYNAAGELLGVVASDVTLQQMQQDITTTRIGETGYAFLMEETGQLVAHPQMDENSGVQQTVLNLALLTGESGLIEAELDSAQSYIAYHMLPATGWYFAVAVETEEIIAPALSTAQAVENRLYSLQESMNNALWRVVVQFVLILSAAMLLILPVSFLLARTITVPIKQLLGTVESIGKGNFDSVAETNGQDEIVELAQAFNKMSKHLKEYITTNTELALQRERNVAELSIAAKIQAGMLPQPLKGEGFALYCDMRPAQTVGGDFYDFFLLDENHLYLCIADVSGKGVPAALYMAKAKTILADCLYQTGRLAEAMAEANRQLAQDNADCMFVTAFAAVLNLKTGILEYVNAGHNPPMLLCNNTYTALPMAGSPVLGCLPQAEYASQSVLMMPGQLLVMYTDGVTEAENAQGEFYTEKSLQLFLNSRNTATGAELAAIIEQEVATFANGAMQADDITLVILERP